MSLSRIPSTFASYVSLTKPRITVFVVMTAFVGFVAGTNGPLSSLALPLLLHTLLGTALVASGTSAFNQVREVDLDGLMKRTQDRPLPSGRISLRGAALFAGALSVVGLAELFLFTNVLTTALAAFTLVSYVGLYTPMKTRSHASTVIGAVPGALPPLGGYTAATGALGLPGLALFAILFVWQLPHFFAIGWRHRADYARAGVRILPVIDPSGLRTARQTLLWTAVLLPISILPSLVGTAGFAYAFGAFVLTLLFLRSSLRFARERTDGRARSLFLASIGWLPAILILLVLDRV
jgi:protoheme IX farnesyltransferase